MNEALATSEEVAQYLRVSTPTVRRLATLGRIPGCRIGRQWRFDMAKIDEWAEQRSAANVVAVRSDPESVQEDELSPDDPLRTT